MNSIKYLMGLINIAHKYSSSVPIPITDTTYQREQSKFQLKSRVNGTNYTQNGNTSKLKKRNPKPGNLINHLKTKQSSTRLRPAVKLCNNHEHGEKMPSEARAVTTEALTSIDQEWCRDGGTRYLTRRSTTVHRLKTIILKSNFIKIFLR